MTILKPDDLIINIYSSTRYVCIYHRPTKLSVGGYPQRHVSLYEGFKQDLLNKLAQMVNGGFKRETLREIKKEEKPVEVVVRKRGRPRKYV